MAEKVMGEEPASEQEDSIMKILDDLLSTLNYHPEVRDIRQGPFQTAVLTRNCGLASTPHDPKHHHDRAPVTGAGLLTSNSSRELAFLANSSSLHEAAIGMATINSLLDVATSLCLEINASDLLFQKGKNKRIAIIGHFPFVPRLREVASQLWVIEKKPAEGDLAESEAENLLPQADIIGITGTAFTNHTIEHLLQLCNKKAFVVILGGTSPLSPVLFNHGIDAVCGTRVIEPDRVLRYVSGGATFRQIKGIKLLTMMKDNYC
ncbi:Rossmann-like domain-containing protein [Chloroflexota bacterium]